MFLFRVDFPTSLFVLPYVVQDVLASSTEQVRSTWARWLADLCIGMTLLCVCLFGLSIERCMASPLQ